MVLNVEVWTSWSPWLKLSRATFTPALIRSLVVLYPCVAGPNVATIFACLISLSLWLIVSEVNDWTLTARMSYVMVRACRGRFRRGSCLLRQRSRRMMGLLCVRYVSSLSTYSGICDMIRHV